MEQQDNSTSFVEIATSTRVPFFDRGNGK